VSGLHRALEDYLRVRRSLGFQLERAGKLLPDFLRYLDERGLSHVTTTAALAWATQPRDAQPAWWSARLLVVRGFAKYLQTVEPRTEVPSPELLPHRRARSKPYVYSTADVTALLSATDTLASPFRMATYKTLLGLLAVTGMRVGEVIALDDGDLQRRRALVIRKAKFRKSREIPLHASTVHALDLYRRERDQQVPCRRTASLFVSGHGTRLLYQNVHFTFLRLVYEAGLGERKPRPTIHDLRHTFAIRTVLGWHRDGLDVEARLPLLSTYLGHIRPSSTYWYLSAVPELLEAATLRLTRYTQGKP
jgi:integrase/recombinase XerD